MHRYVTLVIRYPEPYMIRLFLVFISIQFLWAADTLSNCNNAQTSAQMRACENARFASADKELNAVYAGLLKKSNTIQQERLRAAERAWVEFRDANADFLASRAGPGTLAPLIRASALADMTQSRLQELSKLSRDVDKDK